MSGPLPIMPLDTLQAKIGALIEEAKTRNLPMSTLTLMSISEYLKDAERWAYVLEHEYLGAYGKGPKEFTKWVDEEIENERQRFIRARQGRSDGVPGNKGG